MRSRLLFPLLFILLPQEPKAQNLPGSYPEPLRAAENFISTELGKTHYIVGWPELRSDWFVRERYKDLNGTELVRFYEIHGAVRENEFLILKINEASTIVKPFGGYSYVLGKQLELPINLDDSMQLIQVPLSKKHDRNFISYKNFEIDHRGEPAYDVRYKKDKDFDLHMVQTLFQQIQVIRQFADPHERAAPKLVAFKNAYDSANWSKEVTEDQHKFIVQAAAAATAKDYLKALQLYRKAIDINRYSYPAAYFNMAQILASAGAYYQAIYAMKGYIIVTTDAAEVRKAQDKIYEWELFLK